MSKARSNAWKLRSRIDVTDPEYGAKGDGVTDDATAINAAIAAALTLGRQIYFPTGTYKINSPLIAYLASAFITVDMQGEAVSDRNDRGVVIDHSSLPTVPGLIVQGARRFNYNGIQFVGPNNFGELATDFFTEANFITGTVRNSRYSPQCAIAIDPFKNGVPADGGYPGLSAYYTSAALTSSKIRIRNLRLKNQLGGVVFGASGNESNADLVSIDYINCEQVKIPLAFGHIMSKGVNLKSIFVDNAYTVVDCWSFGARNGAAAFHWDGGGITRTFALVRTLGQNGASGAVGESFSIDNLYAESFHTIGWIGDVDGASLLPWSINKSTLWFSGDTANCVDAHLTNFAPGSFNDCDIVRNNSGVDNLLTFALKMYHSTLADQNSLLQFNNVKFMGDWGVLFPSDKLHLIRMNGCSSFSPFFRYSYDEHYKVSSLSEITTGNGVWPGALLDDAETGKLYRIAQGMNSYALGTLTVTKTGTTATFTAADSETLKQFDAIYSTQDIKKIDGTALSVPNWPIGVVDSVNGADITLRNVSESLATGNKALNLKWYGLAHGPSTVTTTSGGKTVAITQSGSAIAWGTGNRIISANIPGGAYLTSATAISKNASATDATGRRAYDADLSEVILKPVGGPDLHTSTFSQLVAKSAVSVNGPADTSENTLATVTLPASSLGANGELRVNAAFSFTNSANNKTLRVYLGTTLLSQVVLTTELTSIVDIIVSNANSEASQKTQVERYDGSTATVALGTAAENTALPKTITITVQKASAGETITLLAYRVEALKNS